LEAPIVILSAIARDTICGGDLGSSCNDNVVRRLSRQSIFLDDYNRNGSYSYLSCLPQLLLDAVVTRLICLSVATITEISAAFSVR
jgi:hypothetical protein